MRKRATAVAMALALLGSTSGPARGNGITSGLEPGASVTVSGYAAGKGIGLSQAGARAAAQQGASYHQIESFYFPHTAPGTASGRISVRITTTDGATLEVRQRSGLVARLVGTDRSWNLTALRPSATRWLVQPRGSGDDLYYYAHSWKYQTTVNGTLQVSAGGAPIRMYHVDGGSVQYRGSLRPDVRHGAVVNTLGLEDYLRGVVPAQLPASWHNPALLKAQAVAARGYAVYQRSRGQKLCDTSACQVYGGFSAETPAGDRAVERTAREILLYDGRPALTVSTRANGGHTRDGGRPYLVARKDPYDPGKGTAWSSTIAEADIEQKWPSAGPLLSLTPHADDSGRWIASITIHGEIRDYTVSGDAFATWAGLRSSWFNLDAVVPAPPTENADSPAAPRVYFEQSEVSDADPLIWTGEGQTGTLTFTRGATDVTPDIDHYTVAVTGPTSNTPAQQVQATWDFTPVQWGYYYLDIYAVDTSGRISAPTHLLIRVA